MKHTNHPNRAHHIPSSKETNTKNKYSSSHYPSTATDRCTSPSSSPYNTYNSQNTYSQQPSSNTTSSQAQVNDEDNRIPRWDGVHDRSHYLQAIGSQFWDHASSTPSKLSTVPLCPYHGPILALQPSLADRYQAPQPLERYLDAHSSEQYALFNCRNTGRTSIDKGCCCSSSNGGGYNAGYGGH